MTAIQVVLSEDEAALIKHALSVLVEGSGMSRDDDGYKNIERIIVKINLATK
jgi:hypothetical protein